jgi:Transposase IS66 family
MPACDRRSARVFKNEATARQEALTAAERLAYHQAHSGLIMSKLKAWLEGQLSERLVEPNSSLGKAFHYLLLKHWEILTQFLRVPGAPFENNTVERALKLMIRQRRNSLFYASTHSAYVASMLTSVIAICAEAGINALAYLVALQEHRLPRTLEVMARDVVAEDALGRLIVLEQQRADKTDERGIGWRQAHVAGEAADKIVLAAVRASAAEIRSQETR